MIPSVRGSEDLQRILALPKRPQKAPKGLEMEVTKLLRTHWGTQTLKPKQAQALVELAEHKGCLCGILVGGGKTLITALAATVMDAKRPLLIIPADLRQKTKRDFAEYARHWQIREPLIVSYQWMSRVDAADYLDKLSPDLIILDEAHYCANPRAAVTKRINRYWGKHQPKTIALSGSITGSSLRDFSHISLWCLGLGSPLPIQRNEVEQWANAMDPKPTQVVSIGALRVFGSTAKEARKGYGQRIQETPGVVFSDHDTGVKATLNVTLTDPLEGSDCEEIDKAFSKLRHEWETPDGQPLMFAIEKWRVARELICGLYYRWNPKPPKEWLSARKLWYKCARVLIARMPKLDTEKAVKDAIKELGKKKIRMGEDTLDALEILNAWEEIAPTFSPESEAVWISDTTLMRAAEHMKKAPCIVWVEHAAFGIALSRVTGAPYYRNKGLDKLGRFIEDAKPEDGSIIASIASNCTGKNLQQWHRGLIVSPPTTNKIWEQLLGRKHRYGQSNASVDFTVYMGATEHFKGLRDAQEQARHAERRTNQEQKLNVAKLNNETKRNNDTRWSK